MARGGGDNTSADEHAMHMQIRCNAQTQKEGDCITISGSSWKIISHLVLETAGICCYSTLCDLNRPHRGEGELKRIGHRGGREN